MRTPFITAESCAVDTINTPRRLWILRMALTMFKALSGRAAALDLDRG
jgi:hypothetical protein